MLLLERLRGVILTRHNPKSADNFLMRYSETERELIRTYAQDVKGPIHSHMMVKMLEMGTFMGRSTVGMLPLEIALIEHCT
jgi:hypothetical protein